MIRVAIADDHKIVRAGFKHFISGQVDMQMVAEVSNGQQALELARKLAFDVLLLDISMPGQSGVDTLRAIRMTQPDLPILVLSSFPEQQYATSMLRLGANGYLRKDCDPEELLLAIRTVSLGRRYISTTVGELLANGLGKDAKTEPHEELSDRELQVFLRLAAGETVSEIAQRLSISVKTVSTYRTRLMEKLQLKTNSDLTYYAIKNCLIT